MNNKKKGIILILIFCFLVLLSSNFTTREAFGLTVNYRIIESNSSYEVWTGSTGGAQQGGSYATLNEALESITDTNPVIQFGDGTNDLIVPTTSSHEIYLPTGTYTGKIKSSGEEKYFLVIENGSNVTFQDINITIHNETSLFRTIIIYGELTIQGANTNTISAGTGNDSILLENIGGGTLNISGGTIEASGNTEGIRSSGTLNITGGNIKSDGNRNAINILGGITNISGGRVVKTDNFQTSYYPNAIFNSSGVLTISDNAEIISEKRYAIYHRKGTTYINGGTIKYEGSSDNESPILYKWMGTMSIGTNAIILSESEKNILLVKGYSDDTYDFTLKGVKIFNKKEAEISVKGVLNNEFYEISNKVECTIDKASIIASEIDSGYGFVKWSPTSARDTALNESKNGMTIGDNTAFYLDLDKVYKVTYDGNENTRGSVNDNEYFDGETAIIESSGSLERDGYSFTGWNTIADGSGTDYSSGSSLVIESSDINLYAQWEPRTDTSYKVEHYQQNIDNDEYTLFEKDNLTGTTDTEVTAEPNIYTGFSENTTSESGTITGDESLVLKLYYDREEYTVTFKDWDDTKVLKTENVKYEGDASPPDGPIHDGYSFTGWDKDHTHIEEDLISIAQYDINQYTITFDTDGGNEISSITQDYDTSITLSEDPIKTGYSFASWNTIADGSGTDYSSGSSLVIESSDINLYAQWEPRTDTSYKVEHYQQNIDNDGYTLIETENLTGTTDTEAIAVSKNYNGFNENTIHPDRKTTGNISGDGSLVLKLYYDRETYTVTFKNYDGISVLENETVRYEGSAASLLNPEREGYTFSGWDKTLSNITSDLAATAQYSINQYTIFFNTDGGNTVEDITQDYGTDIIPLENPTKPGYSFGGWNPSLPNTMPAEDVTVVAQWIPEGETKYEVEHYQQNINDDGYTLKDTEIKYGKTESTVTSSALEYNGFYFDEDNSLNYLSGDIIGDGSLTLKLYYNREEYTVTFLSHDDEVLKTEDVRYEGSATPPPRPGRSGYDFKEWNEDYTYITADVVTKATYRKEEPEPVVQESIVIVNGEEQSSGTETSLEVDGEMTATYKVDAEKIQEKIDQVLQDNKESTEENTEQNTLEIPIQTTNPDIVKSKLTGDIVKKLEDENFNINIKTEISDYEIPAEEMTITNVAKELGVEESSLEKIEVDVEINKASGSEERQAVVKGREEGYRVLITPVKFKVTARTTSSNGEEKEVEIKEFKNYVKRTLPLPEDIDPNKITTAVLIEKDGKVVHIPTQVFQTNGKWYAKINSLTNSQYTLINNEKEVKGVENHWAEEAVEDLASRKVIEDTEYFLPDVGITRGKFAEYITKALGIYREEVEILEKLTDVEDNDEISSAVYTASKYGIIKGYPDGSFRPEGKITREEAMVMYSRAIKIVELEQIEENKIEKYKDKEEVSKWAFEEVRNTLGAGVFNGRTLDTIVPKGIFTKAEAATAVRNLLIKAELINK